MSTKNGTSEISLRLTPATRSLFSYVPQGNTMFSGTIAENMRSVKPDATDDEIINALKLSCAWDFVSKLPEGIDSSIKERGGGFSEGQSQRLSIANPSSGRGNLGSRCRNGKKCSKKYYA